MKPSQIIRNAASLIRSPGNWAQWHMALSLSGELVAPSSPLAHGLCGVAAIAVSGNGAFEEAYEELRKRTGGSRISDINNKPNGHEMVLELFERTATELEREGR